MTTHKLSAEVLLSGPQTKEDQQALNDTVYDVASQAYGHLDKAK